MYIIIQFLLVSIISGGVGEESIFEFLVVGEEIKVATQVRTERMSLVINIDFDVVTGKKELLDMENLLVEWLGYLPIKNDADLAKIYYGLTSEGVAQLVQVANWIDRILFFQNDLSTYQPEYTCLYNHTCLSTLIMSQNVLNTKEAFSTLKTDWTAATIKADIKQSNAIKAFTIIFSEAMENWNEEFSELMSILDSLASHEFPQALMGHYQSATCIGNVIGENIKVLECTKAKRSYICELEVEIPSTIIEMHSLIPIHYRSIRLRGSTAQQMFAKSKDTADLHVLECNHYNYFGTDVPQCKLLPFGSECLKFLLASDVKETIKNCNFTEHEPDIATHTLSKGLVVQGTDIVTKVRDTAGTKSLSKKTPIIVFSNQEVILEQDSEDFIFHLTSNQSGTRVIQSKLTEEDEDRLEAQYRWQTYWENFETEDFLRFMLLGLQAILSPIVIVGIALGIKARRNMNRLGMLSKTKPQKQIYKRNQMLLKQMKK